MQNYGLVDLAKDWEQWPTFKRFVRLALFVMFTPILFPLWLGVIFAAWLMEWD